MEEPQSIEEETIRSILKTRKKMSVVCKKYLEAIVDLEQKKLDKVEIPEKRRIEPIVLRQISDLEYDDKEIEKEIKEISQQMAEILEIERIINRNRISSTVCHIPHAISNIEDEY